MESDGTTESVTRGEAYLNSKYSFRISWPRGWVKRRELDDARGFMVSYAKHEIPPPAMDLPIFSIMVSPAPFPAKRALDVAGGIFSSWIMSEQRYQIGEPPSAFDLNGVPAAKFLWDKPAWDRFKDEEFWVRILNIYLLNGDQLVTVTLFVRRESFEETYQEIQPALSSFQFTD